MILKLNKSKNIQRVKNMEKYNFMKSFKNPRVVQTLFIFGRLLIRFLKIPYC